MAGLSTNLTPGSTIAPPRCALLTCTAAVGASHLALVAAFSTPCSCRGFQSRAAKRLANSPPPPATRPHDGATVGAIHWTEQSLCFLPERTPSRLRDLQYLAEHGWTEFFHWFDHRSWYPLGRPVGTTIYPGMQITSVVLWKVGVFLRRDAAFRCSHRGLFLRLGFLLMTLKILHL